MRGEVEIWDGDKLLHKESNLLVNGAGELLADIMTVSPSLSGIADHATSSILDASNYTIQAISFGKDASAYQNNAHKYGDRRNLWYDSTFSSIGTGGRGCALGTVEGVDYLLSSLPDETNPPGFEDVPSSTAHVTFLGDKKINAPTANISFSYTLNFNAAQDWQPYGPLQASALQDKWFCTSVYVKAPHPGYPYNLDLTDPGSNSTAAKAEFKNSITAQGTYESGYALGRARNSVNIYWDPTTEPHTLSGIHISSFQGDPRTAAAGFTEDEWNANGGVQDVGDGWYRLWNAIPAPSGGDHHSTIMYPAGYDHGINFGETSGGVYTFGWQLEVGKWPTPLQYNSGYQANAWDLSGSVLNQWYAKYGSEATHPLDKGTVRVLNEPISNPNLLFYTDDPGNSPGLNFPGGDLNGEYWYAPLSMGSFSSILLTNPLGGPSSIELSANDTGIVTDPTYMLARGNITAVPDLTRDRWLRTGYDSIFSFYVKQPTHGVTVSSFMMNNYSEAPAAQSNTLAFEFLGGGNVPTLKSGTNSVNSTDIQSIGDGWYRISVITTGLGNPTIGGAPIIEGTKLSNWLYLGDWIGTPDRSLARLWVSSPQFEQWPIGTKLGPTKYRAVSGVIPNYAEDNLLTSSYTPTNYLSSPPNPESTRVEDRNTTAETFSGIFSSIDFGQNLNMVPWRDYSGMDTQLRTPTSFSAYSILDSTPPTTTYVKDYAWPFKGNAYNYLGNANLITSGVGTLGNQAYYLGCYPEGSSTGGSNWALVSSLDNSAAYLQVANGTDPNFVSGTYNSIVNEASSMDAFGFVGKVYDAKNKVGVLPNPNMLGYTVDTALDPGITFNTDLTGTVWAPFAGGQLGTFSSVLHTNPFGGVSSLILSANGTSLTGRQALATYGGYVRIPDFRADSAMCYSVYVKAHDNPTTSATYFQLAIYDQDAPLISYTESFEFIDGVPTIDGTPAASSTTTIEDVTNGWYRLGITVEGLANTGTSEGDNMVPIFYIGNSNNAADSDVHNKEIYWYAPQVEQHPLSYGITLPTPYQAVAGYSPTVAEQQGEGGLHVSGGIDATNSGTVEYSITVGSGDVGYSNLYGGIYNMGLWTIDMDESIKVGNTPPYSFGPLNNPRKYKLFSTKHLTKNLGFIEDDGTNAGALNYTDLTIKWRLHFL